MSDLKLKSSAARRLRGTVSLACFLHACVPTRTESPRPATEEAASNTSPPSETEPEPLAPPPPSEPEPEPPAPAAATMPPTARLLGALPRPLPMSSATTTVSVGQAVSGTIADGVAHTWGATPTQWAYRNDDPRAIRLPVDNPIQLLLEDRTAAVLSEHGTVTVFESARRAMVRRRIQGPRMQSIATGTRGTCGVATTGEVYCWDDATLSDIERSRPRRVAGLGQVQRIAMGAFGADLALLRDGTVRTFGASYTSGFGVATPQDGDELDLDSPRVAQPPVQRVVDIAAAGYTRCVLIDDGRVWCWGHPLGDPDDEPSSDGPTSETPVLEGGIDAVVGLSASRTALCVRRVDRSVACRGLLPFGFVEEHMPRATSERWVDVPALHGATELALESDHACWRSESGLRCIGNNASGQLGVLPRRSAVLAVPGVVDARWVSVGISRTCAGGAEAVWCWSSDDSFDLTFSVPERLPVLDPGTVRDVWEAAKVVCVLRQRQVRVCYEYTGAELVELSRLGGVTSMAGPCVLQTPGVVRCGYSETIAGPPGRFSSLVRTQATLSALRLPGDPPQNEQFTAVIEGSGRVVTFGLTSDGAALTNVRWAWVHRDTTVAAMFMEQMCTLRAGGVQCGMGAVETIGIPHAEELAAGPTFAICARVRGTVRCTGFLDAVELMRIAGQEHPDASWFDGLPGLRDAVAVATGANHVCALRRSGLVACFAAAGFNGVGTRPAAWFAGAVAPLLTPE